MLVKIDSNFRRTYLTAIPIAALFPWSGEGPEAEYVPPRIKLIIARWNPAPANGGT